MKPARLTPTQCQPGHKPERATKPTPKSTLFLLSLPRW